MAINFVLLAVDVTSVFGSDFDLFGNLFPSPRGGGEQVAEQVEITAKYAGYIDRQQDEIDRQLANESLRLPNNLDYSAVRGLSKEVQIKLTAQRPETLGQAGRISGITPAAISLLLVHLKRGRLAEMVA